LFPKQIEDIVVRNEEAMIKLQHEKAVEVQRREKEAETKQKGKNVIFN